MLTSRLPPAVEFSRLQRLKETVLGDEPKRQSSIIATDDWIAEVDARLADLERAVVPPFRTNPRPMD
jgi:hypothetical protein